MGYASRLVPPSEIARAKALPLREPRAAEREPVDSVPADDRNAIDAAFTEWLRGWCLDHGLDEAFLTKELNVSVTVVGRKLAPRNNPKDRATPWTAVDIGKLKPRLRSQFLFDMGAFFARYDVSH